MGLTGIAFLVAFVTGCALALVRHPIFGLMTISVLLPGSTVTLVGQEFLRDALVLCCRGRHLGRGADQKALSVHSAGYPQRGILGIRSVRWVDWRAVVLGAGF